MTAFQLHSPRLRYSLFTLWLLVVAGALYLYFFQRAAVQSELQDALSASFWAAAIAYLLIGSFRAFTLVPATFPLLIAMPFFDPWVLLALTLPCIAISSSICYFFAEAIHMDEVFERLPELFPFFFQNYPSGEIPPHADIEQVEFRHLGNDVP